MPLFSCPVVPFHYSFKLLESTRFSSQRFRRGACLLNVNAQTTFRAAKNDGDYLPCQHAGQSYGEEDLHSLSHVVSTNAGMQMALKDHQAMQLILDSLDARKDVASAYLLSPSGQSIVSYSSDGEANRKNPEEKVDFFNLESQQINEGRQLGSEIVWNEKGRLAHFMTRGVWSGTAL